jgi:hypothetical protein
MSSSAPQEQPQSYAQRKLAELTQGLKRVKNIEDAYAPDIWPEDDIEAFLAWLDRCRHGEE